MPKTKHNGPLLLALLALLPLFWFTFSLSLLHPPLGVSTSSFGEPGRLSGPWFEIARLDNSRESIYADQVTILLKPETEKSLRLVLTGNERKTGQLNVTQLTAEWAEQSDASTLLTPCLKWFTCGLHVIDLDDDNMTWAIVAGPSRDYLWILSRAPGVQPAQLEKLIAIAADQGFDVSRLKINNHPPAIFKPAPRASESVLPQSTGTRSAMPAPSPEGPTGFVDPMGQAPEIMMDEPPPMPTAPPPMPPAPPPMPAAPPPMPEVILPAPRPLPPLPEKESGKSQPEGSEATSEESSQ